MDSETTQTFDLAAARALPGPSVTAWCRAHQVAVQMLWRSEFGDQVEFVCDQLPRAWAMPDEYARYAGVEGDLARVVGHHHSKSIDLPVYLLDAPGHGFAAIIRSNFCDHKVTVVADHEVVVNPTRLFDPWGRVDPARCHGFDAAWVLGPYGGFGSRAFTAELQSDHALYTFFHLIARHAEAVKTAPDLARIRADRLARMGGHGDGRV